MKERLDDAMVSRGLADTKSQAKRLIDEKLVAINNEIAQKAGTSVFPKDVVSLTKAEKYVGIGAFKLEAAMTHFQIDANNKTVADVGACTGGFTDYLLQHGAKKVYAIDVGHSQLAQKLKDDPRVVNLEKTNIRENPRLPEKMDFAVADLSYISILLVLENIFSLIKKDGFLIALIKPQFEVGPHMVNKQGVVKNIEARDAVLKSLLTSAALAGFAGSELIESPIKGKNGNTEFLAIFSRSQH